jgi:hypothetical protein
MKVSKLEAESIDVRRALDLNRAQCRRIAFNGMEIIERIYFYSHSVVRRRRTMGVGSV